ncbi:MAG: GIY-YIG nuclease family protein [Terriglobales bacterium]
MSRERKSYCVYIMGSLSGTLYIGMTGNLHRRVFEHKFHRIEGFTDKYRVGRLLYWESFDEVQPAINREKQLKGWRRSKKITLMEFVNPHWLDLARDWYPWMENSEGSRGPSTPQDDARCASSCSAQDDERGMVKKGPKIEPS